MDPILQHLIQMNLPNALRPRLPRNLTLRLFIVSVILFSGALVGAGFYIAAIVIALAPLSYPLLRKAFEIANTGASDALFWTALSIFITASLAQSLGLPKFDAIVDVYILAAAPIAVAHIIKQLPKSKALTYYFTTLITLHLYEIFASIIGRSTFSGASFQLLTNLKLYSLLAIGLITPWTQKTDNFFWSAIRAFAYASIALLAIDLISPATYTAVFKGAYTIATTAPGLKYRYTGIFPHYSAAGYFFGLLTLMCFIRARLVQKSYYIDALMFSACLAGTLERSEIASVALIVLVFLYVKGNRKTLIIRGVTAITIACVFAYIFLSIAGSSLAEESARWGVVGNRAIVQPRPTVYMDSFRLATEHFPLGTGLGTFGSAGALKFDHSLYLQLGYAAYGWLYGPQTVLMDTYWPNFIAELGWVGAAVVFVLLATPPIHSFLKVWRHEPDPRQSALWSLSFVANAYIFIGSLTSNAYQDSGIALIPIIFYGAALQMDIYKKTKTTERSKQ